MATFVFLFLLGFLTTELSATQQVSANIQSQLLWKSIVHDLWLAEKADIDLAYTDLQSCSSSGHTWVCCAHIHSKKLKINDTACLKLLYLPEAIGLEVDLLWNNKTIYTKSISVKNPPPLCVGLPHLTDVSVCIILYNVTISHKRFSSCFKLRIEAIIHEDFKLGCFSVPPSTEKRIGHRSFKRLLYPPLSNTIDDANVFKMDKTEKSGESNPGNLMMKKKYMKKNI